MVIRILPRLSNRREWIDFCSRERSYCFVENPSVLVDFQSSLLILTLLPNGLADGRKAVKYSIGSAQTIKPAWEFIKGCQFDLAFMINGLESVNFDSNARDNHYLGFCPEANVRKYFNKEASIIAPDSIGNLPPLDLLPSVWSHRQLLCLLANHQFTELRAEQTHLHNEQDTVVKPEDLIIKLIEHPDDWQVRLRNQRLWLIQHAIPRYSLIPNLDREAS